MQSKLEYIYIHPSNMCLGLMESKGKGSWESINEISRSDAMIEKDMCSQGV